MISSFGIYCGERVFKLGTIRCWIAIRFYYGMEAGSAYWRYALPLYFASRIGLGIVIVGLRIGSGIVVQIGEFGNSPIEDRTDRNEPTKSKTLRGSF